MEFNTFISANCFKSFQRYENEILLEVHQHIIDSKDPVIKKNILFIKQNHLYGDLKFHIDILKSFLYFNDSLILKKYILWRYRVYFYRDVDLEYIKLEYKIWKAIVEQFVEASCISGIVKIYDYLIKNHERLSQEALEYNFTLDDSLEQALFESSLELQPENLIKISEPYCQNLKSFCEFFSTKINNVTHYVGNQWEINQLSVAKEHMSTANIESMSQYFLNKYETSTMSDTTILVASLKDEFHSLGMKISIEILKKLGYKIINLGTNTPSKNILNTILEFQCDYIIISGSLPTNLASIASLIKEIKLNNFDQTSKIILGGNAFSFLSEPLKLIDSELYFNNFQELYSFFINK